MFFSNVELQAQTSVKSVECIPQLTELEQNSLLPINGGTKSNELNFFIDGNISENDVNIENELQVPAGESLQLDPQKSVMTFSEPGYIYILDTKRNNARSAIISQSTIDFLLA